MAGGHRRADSPRLEKRGIVWSGHLAPKISFSIEQIAAGPARVSIATWPTRQAISPSSAAQAIATAAAVEAVPSATSDQTIISSRTQKEVATRAAKQAIAPGSPADHIPSAQALHQVLSSPSVDDIGPLGPANHVAPIRSSLRHAPTAAARPLLATFPGYDLGGIGERPINSKSGYPTWIRGARAHASGPFCMNVISLARLKRVIEDEVTDLKSVFTAAT